MVNPLLFLLRPLARRRLLARRRPLSRCRLFAHPFLLALLVLLAACDPEADDQPWRVASPRLLAVLAEPAEAPPGAAVQLDAFVLGPEGPAAASLRWGRCARRKPLTELGPADPACLREEPGAWIPLGEGPGASLSLPPDACRLFGPDRPDPKPGEPAGRPVDPDTSGGYYLPFSVHLDRSRSAGFARLRCDLSGATQQAVISFGKLYRPNQNPAIRGLAVALDQTILETPADPDPLVLPRGRAVAIQARWDTCPATPVCGDGVCSPGEEIGECIEDCQPLRGCSGAEFFALYDPSNQQVSVRQEALRVSWFATGGTLNDSATAPATPTTPSAVTSWITPDAPGEFWLAAVLRDERGGAGVRTLRVRVE